MSTKSWCAIAILSPLFASFLLPGCTLIGFAVGDSMDRAARKEATGPAARVISLKPGRTITVTYKNGQQMTGVYQGLRQRPASEYIPLYEGTRANRFKATLPAIGDTLSVVLHSGKIMEALLAGFGLYCVWLKSPKEASLTYIPVSDIARIMDRRGLVFDTLSLRSIIVQRRVPSVVTVLLRQDSGDVNVPPEWISRVPVHVKPHYWLIYGGVGLIVDAAVVAALIYSAIESMNLSWNCPVQSGDGIPV